MYEFYPKVRCIKKKKNFYQSCLIKLSKILIMMLLLFITLFHMCTTATQQEIVDQHNNFRRLVQPSASNMLRMKWDNTLADSAQQWVNQCQLTPSPVSGTSLFYGENLFLASKPCSWTEVVTAWHSEVKNYQFPTGSTNGRHVYSFLQVVWYSSYQVGCGAAQCGNLYFYACQYLRAGNFKGIAPYTAGEPCAECPNSCEDNLCTNPCPYIDKSSNCPTLKLQEGCNTEDTLHCVLCFTMTITSLKKKKKKIYILPCHGYF
uniref:SCP domain-containing protein n=1 Tax=Denticeps clupeoides TaxID=299321 RepID=A0AAY4ASK3_9TELE